VKPRIIDPKLAPHWGEVVRVPIYNRLKEEIDFAELYADDLAKLEQLGLGPRWYFNRASGKSYVAATERFHRGRNAQIARLISGAPKGLVVRYRDDDPRNLRRENLYFQTGNAKGKTPQEVSQNEQPQAA
jgi:hypothetical protein